MKRKPAEIPVVSLPPQPHKARRTKKPSKAKVKAKKQSKLPQIGEPPIDQAPPDFRDRPQKANLRLGEPRALETAAPQVTPPPKPPEPPAKPVVTMTGRMVMGQSCTWLGDLGEAPDNEQGQPCCPYCKGVLIEAGPPEQIRLGMINYELGQYDSVNPPPRPHPGYTMFTDWMRKQPRCWPTGEEAASDYAIATGRKVDIAR